MVAGHAAFVKVVFIFVRLGLSRNNVTTNHTKELFLLRRLHQIEAVIVVESPSIYLSQAPANLPLPLSMTEHESPYLERGRICKHAPQILFLPSPAQPLLVWLLS